LGEDWSETPEQRGREIRRRKKGGAAQARASRQ